MFNYCDDTAIYDWLIHNLINCLSVHIASTIIKCIFTFVPVFKVARPERRVAVFWHVYSSKRQNPPFNPLSIIFMFNLKFIAYPIHLGDIYRCKSIEPRQKSLQSFSTKFKNSLKVDNYSIAILSHYEEQDAADLNRLRSIRKHCKLNQPEKL